MDVFNPHNKDKHEGTEIIAEKKHEYKFVGSSIRRRGQELWALDAETLKVYKINLVKRELINMKGKEFGKFKAFTKMADPMLWALNKINAVRKFKAAAHKDKTDLIN